MTDDELDELERLANAATPGPWRVADPREGAEVGEDLVGGGLIAAPMPPGRRWTSGRQSDADDQYIAATSPDVVLALIAEVRRLRVLHAALLPAFESHNARHFCDCYLCAAFAAMAHAIPYEIVNQTRDPTK